MKAKIGTIVETEFGKGPIVAITKLWVIQSLDNDLEVAVYIPDNWIGIPADVSEPDVDGNAELEIK